MDICNLHVWNMEKNLISSSKLSHKKFVHYNSYSSLLETECKYMQIVCVSVKACKSLSYPPPNLHWSNPGCKHDWKPALCNMCTSLAFQQECQSRSAYLGGLCGGGGHLVQRQGYPGAWLVAQSAASHGLHSPTCSHGFRIIEVYLRVVWLSLYWEGNHTSCWPLCHCEQADKVSCTWLARH